MHYDAEAGVRLHFKKKVVTTLALAEQHDCDRLKEVCYRFLASFQNLKAVTLTNGFKHLKIIRPNILEELLRR